jgi:hypothetical protein
MDLGKGFLKNARINFPNFGGEPKQCLTMRTHYNTWISFYDFFIVVFASLICCSQPVQAQGFLKKLKDKTIDKLSDRASDELSAMAVEAMMKPIRQKRYQMMRDQYKEQYGEEFDESKYETPEEAEAALYQSMFSFYGNVDLPEQYLFNYEVEIETKDNKEKYNAVMLVSTTSSIFGMSYNEKGNNGRIVMDYENDLMVTYDDEKMESFAIKGMMKMAKIASTSYIDDEEAKQAAGIVFEPISKTKKVAGCESKGYRIESQDGKGEAYYCDDLPFDWKDTFGGLLTRISPDGYQGYADYYQKGMPVYAKFESIDGDNSQWEVKKISEKEIEIVNAKYTLANDQFAAQK